MIDYDKRLQEIEFTEELIGRIDRDERINLILETLEEKLGYGLVCGHQEKNEILRVAKDLVVDLGEHIAML